MFVPRLTVLCLLFLVLGLTLLAPTPVQAGNYYNGYGRSYYNGGYYSGYSPSYYSGYGSGCYSGYYPSYYSGYYPSYYSGSSYCPTPATTVVTGAAPAGGDVTDRLIKELVLRQLLNTAGGGTPAAGQQALQALMPQTTQPLAPTYQPQVQPQAQGQLTADELTTLRELLKRAKQP